MPAIAPNRHHHHPRPPWWFRLVRASLNLALLALLGLQVFVLVILGTEKHLSLPGFALHALEDRLQDQGLSVQFSNLQVSLSGHLQLSNVRMLLAGTREPVAEAEYLEIEPEWFMLLWNHQLAFSEARLVNANFYCPPEISPTGEREAFIERLDAGISSQGGRWWQLDHLCGRFLNMRVFAQGTFRLPTPEVPVPGPAMAARYRQLARMVAALQPQFARVENPTVEVNVAGDEAGLTRIRVSALAEGAKLPDLGLTFGGVWAHATVVWDGRALHARGPVTAWTESMHYQPKVKNGGGEIFSSGDLWARVQPAEGPEGLNGDRPARVMIWAAPATVNGFRSDGLTVDADLRAWPRLPVALTVIRGPEWLKLSSLVNLEEQGGAASLRDAVVDFHAQTNFATILEAGQVRLPPSLEALKFDQVLRLDGRLGMTAQRQFDALDLTVRTGGAHFQRIDLESVMARGRLTQSSEGELTLNVTEASLVNKTWEVDGSYVENLSTQDFQIQVQGDLDPSVLDPYLLVPWWKPVWGFIVPHGQWPQGDLAYAGNWKHQRSTDPIFASFHIAGARVHGVPMEQISGRVVEREGVVAVYDLAAKAEGGGQLTGALLWLLKPPYDHLYEQRYMLDSTLPLAAVGAIAGPEVMEIVRPVDSATPPLLHVDQRLGESANPQVGELATKVHAAFAKPFHVFLMPLEHATVEATAYNGFTDIPHFDFGFAGGEAVAKASVTRDAAQAEQLAFTVLLQNAQHTSFFSALGDFRAGEGNATAKPTANDTGSQAEPAQKPNSMLGDPTKPGLLDLALGGRFTLGQPDSLMAEGHVRIHDAQLGQLQLLGRLSRSLADTKVALGDFDLHSAESDVQIARDHVRLPNLAITGPSARILSAGTYDFRADELNFNTLIFPIGEWDSFLMKQIASLANPFSNTVTLKLHGKIEKPEWDISMNPLRLFKDRTVEGPSIPGLPADEDGTAILPPPPLPPPPLLPDLPATASKN